MNLVINDNKHYIPNKWNEVKLSRYMNFMNTYREDVSEAEQQLHLISTIVGASMDDVGDAKKSVIDGITDRLAELMANPASENLVLEFEIDGVEYGFNPNLSELKLKEFVDLDGKLENGWQDMHKVMAILYRPIIKRHKEKYEIEDYDFRTAAKRADIFADEMSVEIVNAAASFFLTIAVDYIKITQAYSKANRKQRRQHTRQMKKNLKKNMDGMA